MQPVNQGKLLWQWTGWLSLGSVSSFWPHCPSMLCCAIIPQNTAQKLLRPKPHFLPPISATVPPIPPPLPYQVTSVDRWETAVYFLSRPVFQREKRASHPAVKTVGLISGYHVCTRFPLFQLLLFLSLHPFLPSVIPLSGPTLGDTVLPWHQHLPEVNFTCGLC